MTDDIWLNKFQAESNSWYLDQRHFNVLNYIENSGLTATRESVIDDFSPVGEELLKDLAGYFRESKEGMLVLEAKAYRFID